MALAPSGSLPFRIIDTKAEASHIFQSKKLLFPLLNCPRKSRNFSIWRTSGESRRIELPRAAATGSVKGEDGDKSSENSIDDTIEKGKKALDLQRKLLQQIAERRNLVSSIKESVIDQAEDSSEKNEEEKDPSSGSNDGSLLNVDVPSSSAEASIGDQSGSTSLSRHVDFNNADSEEIPLGTGRSRDEIQNEISKSLTPKGATSGLVKRGTNGGQKKAGERMVSNQALHSIDSSKELENAIPKTKQSDILKASESSTLQRGNKDLKEILLENKIDYSKELEHIIPKTKQSDIQKSAASSSLEISNKDSKELTLPGNTDEAENPGSEELKPPPLAGANVMNVILVAAECAPWSKTGGLGDVAGSLPKALARRGHRVMVVVPRYSNYTEAQDIGVRRSYKVDGQDVEVSYFHAYIDGVDLVFIDGHMFRHIEKNIYGGNRADILKRMILFCKAAVEVPWYVPCGGVCYGDGNLVFIANDWHTALLPVYLKAYYRDNGLMKFTRSVLVIHNIAHQGRGPVDDFFYCDLPEHYIDLFKLYDPVGGDHFNIFAAGLKAADRVVTVSHGYAWELKTSEGGWGLHGIINENDWKLRGIVNGIDTKEWNPQLDVHLKSDGYTNYSIETLHTGKPQCKAALQKELGLPVREDVPLIGFIGRLDHQKGVDLIAEAIPWMMGQDVQLVMLGTGRQDLEELLRKFESQYSDKVRGWVGFSVRTAHRITAAADILLMPSRFEPCGLNQLYAMNYGTIPVVHAVGGLRDTVQPFDPFNESGYGWTFDSAEANKLINALANCLLTYREYKNSWEGLQRRGMTRDLSWDRAAENYEEVLVAAKYQW